MNAVSLLLRRRVLAAPLALAAALGMFAHPDLARAQTFAWDGGTSGANTSWATAGNWAGDVLPTTGSNLLFDNRNGAGTIVSPLSVAAAANTYGLITFDNVNSRLPATLQILANGGAGVTPRTLTLTTGITLANTTTTVEFVGSGGVLTIALSGANTFSVSNGANLQFDAFVAGTPPSGAPITGSGSLAKMGTGTLTLLGTNTYSGGTTISAGGVFAGINGALGSGSVNVSLTGTLTLAATATDAIADGATLNLSGSGLVNLAAASGTLQETVGALIIDGVAQAAGTYGAAGSGATNVNSHFTGNGILTVVPEPGVNALLAAAAAGGLGLVVRRRRSARR